MIPGETRVAVGEIELNEGAERTVLEVSNTGDHPDPHPRRCAAPIRTRPGEAGHAYSLRRPPRRVRFQPENHGEVINAGADFP